MKTLIIIFLSAISITLQAQYGASVAGASRINKDSLNKGYVAIVKKVGTSYVLQSIRADSLLMFVDSLVFNASDFIGLGTVASPLRANNTAITSKTAAYTATALDYTVKANATSGAFAVTLPSAIGIDGKGYVIKKTDAGANAVTVATTSAQTIDGATSYSLATQNKFVAVQSDGANWIIIGNN